MNWKLIETLINRESALYDLTDCQPCAFDYMALDNFDPDYKHDWNELVYSFCFEPNFN